MLLANNVITCNESSIFICRIAYISVKLTIQILWHTVQKAMTIVYKVQNYSYHYAYR